MIENPVKDSEMLERENEDEDDRQNAESVADDLIKKITASKDYCRDCDVPEGLDW